MAYAYEVMRCQQELGKNGQAINFAAIYSFVQRRFRF